MGGDRDVSQHYVVIMLQYTDVSNQHLCTLNLHNVLCQSYLN